MLPETIPVLSTQELESWRPLGYKELCFRFLRKFIDEVEVSDEELLEITEGYVVRLCACSYSTPV